MQHFEFYPRIEYSGEKLVNMLVRGKIRDHILKQNVLYYEYTVQDGQRPDIIATKYYGNPNFTWAIFYANNIFDPLHEWPLNSEDFDKHVKKKYGSLESAKTTVHHYLLDDKFIIDKFTYDDPSIEFSRKKIITNYDYEFQVNEDKRNIKVIDVIHLRQIVNELRNLFNE